MSEGETLKDRVPAGNSPDARGFLTEDECRHLAETADERRLEHFRRWMADPEIRAALHRNDHRITSWQPLPPPPKE